MQRIHTLRLRLQLFLLVLATIYPLTTMATEEPKYDLLEKSAAFQLRQYPPLVIAEVLVEGNLDEISGKGFRLIADYIFGNNKAKTGQREKIAMTAPVTVEPLSEKIAMTAPVTVQQNSGKWRMHFVMPADYTLENLPVPNNPQVNLRELPARKVAVITFSGIASETKSAKKTEELLAWMGNKNLKPISSPELARYNPPWTLPFMRRNEVMVEFE
jgi:hypothetical protein